MKTIYEEFIEYCYSIEKSEEESRIYMERHHVIPKHCGGTNDKSNIIKLSRKNHILAHYYRWLSYNSKSDKIAFLFMKGDPTGEAKRMSGRLSQKNRTFEKRSEASKKAYKTMLERKSGLAARSESWRQNVSKSSKKNILVNRLERFTEETKYLLESKFKFRFGLRSIFIDQTQLTDFSHTSKYLCYLLGIEIKESEHKKFIRLVKGERKIFHGIKLDMAISSQAVEGLSPTEGSETRRMSPNNNFSHECPSTQGLKI